MGYFFPKLYTMKTIKSQWWRLWFRIRIFMRKLRTPQKVYPQLRIVYNLDGTQIPHRFNETGFRRFEESGEITIHPIKTE